MESLGAWLTLRTVKGLTNGSLCSLVQTLGSPQAVLEAPWDLLVQEGGISAHLAHAIKRSPDRHIQVMIDQELGMIEQGKMSVVTILDSQYPHRLKMIPDPPPLLYVTGNLDEADNNALAVVGARRATLAGCAFTEELSRNLASLGFSIVSGLARGIDASAHRGALKVGGRTVAVLGCGIDRTYPPEHRKLRREIESHGAILSEFSPGTPPHGYHFPRRNRIISGLCFGVVVTEATLQSGSLITARLASEQNREVFAVPGPVKDEMSRGPHSLIKHGAKLVERPEDIVSELVGQLEPPFRDQVIQSSLSEVVPQHDLGSEERPIYDLLSYEPITVDEIIAQVRLQPAEVMSILFSLELKGYVQQLPGSRYARI